MVVWWCGGVVQSERLASELAVKHELRRYILQLETTVHDQSQYIEKLKKSLSDAGLPLPPIFGGGGNGSLLPPPIAVHSATPSPSVSAIQVVTAGTAASVATTPNGPLSPAGAEAVVIRPAEPIDQRTVLENFFSAPAAAGGGSGTPTPPSGFAAAAASPPVANQHQTDASPTASTGSAFTPIAADTPSPKQPPKEI